MNPRYRRLLIPGLLLLLLVITLISSLANRAEGAEAGPEVVSRLGDSRITESSGLALSRSHEGIAYTINDSGNAPLVFAIDVATGRTVGTTRVEGGDLVDTEALAIDRDGTLWIADTGDNRESRADAALYAFPEQGRGDHTVTARRYPISYDSGSRNVEALLVHPVTGAKVLISKGLLGGTIYALPPKLRTGGANLAVAQDGAGPSMVTDATFSADGTQAFVRSYTSMFVLDPSDWSVLATAPTPYQKQGETVTAERSSLLVGSEGKDSELVRMPIPATTPSSAPAPAPTVSPAAAETDDQTIAPMVFVFGAVGAAVVLGAGVAIHAKRHR
ncbi:WD40 repeat domain-containing protein [Aeromicrobium panaciterrae]|uniref:hypothetical protein n=1 Tax=Aeromicrobium panaciterrae TaxID=363861 RepID=UPI0031D64909